MVIVFDVTIKIKFSLPQFNSSLVGLKWPFFAHLSRVLRDAHVDADDADDFMMILMVEVMMIPMMMVVEMVMVMMGMQEDNSIWLAATNN